jgi:hypothetical protein
MMALLGQGFNFSGFNSIASPYEDLSTYTEVDADSDITKTAAKVSWTTMNSNIVSRVFYDYGVDYFSGDFEIQFEAEFTNIDANAACTIFCISNTLGAYGDQDIGANGFSINMERGATDVDLMIWKNGVAFKSWAALGAVAVIPKRWYTFTRVGTTITATSYTDSGRTSVEDTGNYADAAVTAFRYLYALNSYDIRGGVSSTGYVQNIEIVSN